MAAMVLPMCFTWPVPDLHGSARGRVRAATTNGFTSLGRPPPRAGLLGDDHQPVVIVSQDPHAGSVGPAEAIRSEDL